MADLERSLRKASEAGSHHILVSANDWFTWVKNSEFARVEEFRWLVEVDWIERRNLPRMTERVGRWVLVAKGTENSLKEIGDTNLWPIERFDILIRPSKIFPFVTLLDQLPSSTKRPIYFEFLPWRSSHPFRFTAQEIRSFIKTASRRRPDIRIQSYPGLEVWDDRFEKHFEMEPITLPEIDTRPTTSEPAVSIVIPSRDSGSFLRSVLLNLFAQDYPSEKFEIVVVDDGSIDNTKEIVEQLAREHSHIHLAYVPLARLSVRLDQAVPYRAGVARNIGSRWSRGEYLLFLDADIVVRPQFLSTLMAAANEADVIQCERHHIHPRFSEGTIFYNDIDLASQTYVEEAGYRRKFHETDDWHSLPIFWKYACTYCFFLRKKDFLAVGRFKRCFATYGFEDVDIAFELAKQGKRFKLLHEKVLHLTPKHSRPHPVRNESLKITAKIFFHQHIDPEIYDNLKIFMRESPWWPRFREKLRGTEGRWFR